MRPTTPTLRWCENCNVGWSLPDGWVCWCCGGAATVEREVVLTSIYSPDGSCNAMVAAAQQSDPVWDDDPCTGQTLPAAA